MLIKIVGGDPRPQDASPMIEGVAYEPPTPSMARGGQRNPKALVHSIVHDTYNAN